MIQLHLVRPESEAGKEGAMALQRVIQAQDGEIMHSPFLLRILPVNTDIAGTNLQPTQLLVKRLIEIPKWRPPPPGMLQVRDGPEITVVLVGVRWEDEHHLVNDLKQGLIKVIEHYPSWDRPAALAAPLRRLNGASEALYAACTAHQWDWNLFER